MRTLLNFALACLCVTACGDEEADPRLDATTANGSADALLEASAPEPTVDGGPDAAAAAVGENLLAVLDTLGFAREIMPGIAPGFNVDGLISRGTEPESCFKPDYTSPDGTPGIDNQMAKLVPLLEVAGLGAAEGLAQGAIEDGGLLILVEISGVDDRLNDEQVSVRIRAAQGLPLLGTDGKLLPGQTFHLHPESPDSLDPNGRVTDGWLEAGPFEAHVPIVVFGLRYDVTVQTARIRARFTEDGSLVDGVLGGGVTIENLMGIGRIAARDDTSVLTAIEAVFGSNGDLEPDDSGRCQQVSAAFTFSAVSAFLFDEGPPD
ncbi:MAG: hypothetical protein EXR76_08275 [Myxococcales bacterium]|nr:hypothetical protein [Myxococcales bacterium]